MSVAQTSWRFMTVITETRYGGVYEGGPWAAFGVESPASVPTEAFGGDPCAVDWWDNPTVPVGVGTTPDASFARLRALQDRDRDGLGRPLFDRGERVSVVRCVPSDWYRAGEGTVVELEHRPSRPFVGGLRGQGVYAVRFEGSDIVRVPERYLIAPLMS
jgi:hypothetical protein